MGLSISFTLLGYPISVYELEGLTVKRLRILFSKMQELAQKIEAKNNVTP